MHTLNIKRGRRRAAPPALTVDLALWRFLSLSLPPSSAGIGRTGVLITMETALTLLDAARPVFPLDIVRTLRDQRAMMVQTTVHGHNQSHSAHSHLL